MAKRRRFTAEFKTSVVFEALSGEIHKWKCVDDITPVKINSQRGSTNSFLMT